MERTETKNFVKQADGKLLITVDTTDKLMLPTREVIGELRQKTEQFVDMDKVDVLKAFIEGEKKKADDQLNSLTANLEKLQNVDANLVPADLMDKVNKALEKGTKASKEKFAHLQQYIKNSQQKKAFEGQLEFMKGQVKVIQDDLDALNKALK